MKNVKGSVLSGLEKGMASLLKAQEIQAQGMASLLNGMAFLVQAEQGRSATLRTEGSAGAAACAQVAERKASESVAAAKGFTPRETPVPTIGKGVPAKPAFLPGMAAPKVDLKVPGAMAAALAAKKGKIQAPVAAAKSPVAPPVAPSVKHEVKTCQDCGRTHTCKPLSGHKAPSAAPAANTAAPAAPAAKRDSRFDSLVSLVQEAKGTGKIDGATGRPKDIVFPAFPSQKVLQALRDNGFRGKKADGVWVWNIAA